MDARLTEEQRQIRETVDDLVDSNGGIEFARRRMDGDDAVIDEVWDHLAELDVPALTVPLEYGGLGEGLVYLSALLEVVGRYALPGPLSETAAFAAPLIAELGTAEQRDRYLPAIADGDCRLSYALYDDAGESLPEGIRTRAAPLEDGFRLDGTKTLVPHADAVDAVVLAARTRAGTSTYDGISLFVIDPTADAVERRRLESLDQTRPLFELTIDGLEVGDEALLGPLHGGGSALAGAIDRFTVASCATLVGAADRAVELSAAYGREREQYGQPIGRFQAVKHRIVDMWIDVQSARSLVYYAAWAINADEPDASRAASMAKAFAADRLHRVFADDIWNHGGMGFTWDHDAHIYLKAAKAWRNVLGSPEEHRDRLIDTRLSTLEE